MLFTACHDDSLSTDSVIPLSFSVDTLRFDTVFTEAGSATRSFKIFNELDQAVLINSLKLENTSSSFFRLNADGFAGQDLKDIRIEPNDSIYVFAEVTIDPDNPLSISPFFIEENIEIRANDSEYTVLLEAWGQSITRGTNFYINITPDSMETIIFIVVLIKHKILNPTYLNPKQLYI